MSVEYFIFTIIIIRYTIAINGKRVYASSTQKKKKNPIVTILYLYCSRPFRLLVSFFRYMRV